MEKNVAFDKRINEKKTTLPPLFGKKVNSEICWVYFFYGAVVNDSNQPIRDKIISL